MTKEVLILVVYSASLLFVILGVSIGFWRVHKKLDRVISLITGTNRYEENDVRYCGNEGQDNLPDSVHATRLNDSYQHDSQEKDSNSKGKFSFHDNTITKHLLLKQLRFSRTACIVIRLG